MAARFLQGLGTGAMTVALYVLVARLYAPDRPPGHLRRLRGGLGGPVDGRTDRSRCGGRGDQLAVGVPGRGGALARGDGGDAARAARGGRAARRRPGAQPWPAGAGSGGGARRRRAGPRGSIAEARSATPRPRLAGGGAGRGAAVVARRHAGRTTWAAGGGRAPGRDRGDVLRDRDLPALPAPGALRRARLAVGRDPHGRCARVGRRLAGTGADGGPAGTRDGAPDRSGDAVRRHRRRSSPARRCTCRRGWWEWHGCSRGPGWA